MSRVQQSVPRINRLNEQSFSDMNKNNNKHSSFFSHNDKSFKRFAYRNRGISTYIFSMSCFSSKAVGRSLLLPRTKTWNRNRGKKFKWWETLTLQWRQQMNTGVGRTLTGIPCNWGLSNKLWSSFLDASTFSRSAASTMYLKKKKKWAKANKNKHVALKLLSLVLNAYSFFCLQTVEYLHNCIDTPTVTLPHAPEPRLPAYIPDLQTNQTSVESL